MQTRPKAILGAAFAQAALAALLMSGCGSSAPAEGAKITFSSSAIKTNATIPALYTCDGRNITPPLQWGTVPPGTHELVLFVLGVNPEASGSEGISVEWSAAGISPHLRSLAAGELPKGAALGMGKTGHPQRYSICPPHKAIKEYQFELYALPTNDAVAPNFAGLALLSALHPPGRTSSPIPHGAFVAVYKRK